MNVKGSVNRSSRAVLGGAMVSCLVFGSARCVVAQGGAPCRLVDYVSPSVLSRPTTSRRAQPTNTAASANAKAQDLGDIPKFTCTTSTERWITFEKEYGIQKENSWLIGRVFQVCKYGLDTITFTVQESAKRLEFSYNVGDEPVSQPSSTAPAPQYSLPMFGRFGRAQVKSEVTVHDPQTGQAFVGLKLAIPFGQGG